MIYEKSKRHQVKHSRPFETYLGYDLNGQHTGKQTPHDAQRYRSSLSVLVHDGADRVAEIAAFVLHGGTRPLILVTSSPSGQGILCV